MQTKNSSLLTLIPLCLALGWPGALRATTYTYTGASTGASGQWHVAANWDPPAVPGYGVTAPPYDDLVFGSGTRKTPLDDLVSYNNWAISNFNSLTFTNGGFNPNAQNNSATSVKNIIWLAPPNFGLSLKETTIGDRLKAAGYATGWFGKSHLGYKPEFHPLRRGFDEYFGFLGGMHDYLDAASDAHNPILRGTNQVSAIGYTTDDFAREAVAFIEKHRATPWFVYLAFNAVHAPLQATEKYRSRFTAIEDTRRRTFAAMLSAMDDAVGMVLARIRELGQEEDTLIFFLSDNGGPTGQTTSSNGPLRGFKMQTWEGGIRVAWIVQWKGHIPSGKADDRPVIQLDILPTALAAAGVAVQPGWKLDGVNLLPYLTGQNPGLPHEALYWRLGQQMAIRAGDWKLVKSVGSAGVEGPESHQKANPENAELYNLARDIGEKEDLAAREPGRVRALSEAWRKWNAALAEPSWYANRGEGKNSKKAKK